MEFKKECIHCVPDESLIGKRVLCADTYKEIIEQVESNNLTYWIEVLVEIDESDMDSSHPFVTKDSVSGIGVEHYHTFVYYDPEWDKKDKETLYYCFLDRDKEPIQFMFDCEKPSSRIYATFNNKNDASNWCNSHDKFAKIAKAWEDGKTIQFYEYNEEDWCVASKPSWDLNTEYRVKLDELVEIETSEGKMYLANGAEIPKKRRMTNRELARWLAQGKGQWKGVATCAVKNSYSYIYGMDDIKVPDSIMIRGWNETEWHEPEVEVSV